MFSQSSALFSFKTASNSSSFLETFPVVQVRCSSHMYMTQPIKTTKNNLKPNSIPKAMRWGFFNMINMLFLFLTPTSPLIISQMPILNIVLCEKTVAKRAGLHNKY